MNNANQIRKRDECETIKRQFMSQKIAVGEVYRMKKIVFDDLRFRNDHHLACIVYR